MSSNLKVNTILPSTGTAIGIGTASGNVNVFGHILGHNTPNISGINSVTASHFFGAVSSTTGTFTGDVSIADKIIHTGDTDTTIRFPANDTISMETAGGERLRIGSSGQIGLGGANYGSSGQVLTSQGSGSAVAWSTVSTQDTLSFRNLAINGADMMVAQRGTSTSNLRNTGGVFTIDRFAHRRGGTWSNAYWKDEQVNSGTGLFRKSLKKTTTTAEGNAPGAGEYVMIGHYLEAGDTITAFGDGSAEAKSFTVSFYVKASIATTYCLHVATSHLSTDKAFMRTFTVNNPNVWERKTCTIDALTNSIGSVSGSDNATGLRIHWVLDAPQGGQAANTWYTHGNFDFPSGTSSTGYANTLNATFELGGVQIEAGTVATDLEHRSFGEELTRCQRYYQKDLSRNRRFWGSGNVSNRQFPVRFDVAMRDTPSVSFPSSSLDSGSPSANGINKQGYYFNMSGSGRFYEWQHIANAEI